MSVDNHLNLVVKARAKYDAFPGRQRAYLICNAVAWELRLEGAGLFYKTGTNSYAERSSDVLIFRTGAETFDILGDAEGQAIPAWGPTQPTGHGPIANWRAPLDPATLPGGGGTPVPPDPPPTPPPSTDLTARVAALEATVKAQAATLTTLQQQTAALDLRLVVLGNRVTALESAPPGGGSPGQSVETSRSGGGWYGPGHTHTVVLP
jgi:uncharacterized coiled-coil protein SlyX